MPGPGEINGSQPFKLTIEGYNRANNVANGGARANSPAALNNAQPGGATAESVADGRALLLSPVESGTGVNKQRAVWCNEYVIMRAARVWCGHINQGGTLHSILKAAGLSEDVRPTLPR